LNIATKNKNNLEKQGESIFDKKTGHVGGLGSLWELVWNQGERGG